MNKAEKKERVKTLLNKAIEGMIFGLQVLADTPEARFLNFRLNDPTEPFLDNLLNIGKKTSESDK